MEKNLEFQSSFQCTRRFVWIRLKFIIVYTIGIGGKNKQEIKFNRKKNERREEGSR